MPSESNRALRPFIGGYAQAFASQIVVTNRYVFHLSGMSQVMKTLGEAHVVAVTHNSIEFN
tara:strand:+ start:152 stop:334 length:183 start_codon:yes stop_codon:yes gene_type:complete